MYLRLRHSMLMMLGLLLIFYWTPAYSAAETVQSEQKQLLEKSLSVIELDQEVERIRAQQADLQEEIHTNDQKTKDQKLQLTAQHEHMAELLRTYYTGERQSLWKILTRQHSWKDMLSMFDYLNMLLNHDRLTLKSYTNALQNLQDHQTKLKTLNQQLEDLIIRLEAQKHQLIITKQEVDEQLAKSPDADSLKRLIHELSGVWQSQGQDLFKTYFKALADAMKDFPEMLSTSNQELSLHHMNYTVQIQDSDLNAFLQRKNRLFNDLSFIFEPDRVIAEGQKDDMSVRIVGHYSVVQTPKNKIQFHIDYLEFNGLTLPDTTKESLERNFDLNFYPQKIMSVFKASAVKVEKNKLTVELELDL